MYELHFTDTSHRDHPAVVVYSTTAPERLKSGIRATVYAVVPSYLSVSGSAAILADTLDAVAASEKGAWYALFSSDWRLDRVETLDGPSCLAA